jgi:hypothetical protein
VKAYEKDGGGDGSSKDIVDSFLKHQIYLSRFSTYEARKLVTILDNANSLIKQRILKAKSIDTKAHYGIIAREIRKIMDEAVESLDEQLELDFTDLADEEIQFVEKTLSQFTVKADFALPAPKQVWAAASFGPYAGTDGKFTFQKYMDSLGDNAFNTWDIACRAAYLSGTPAKSIVKSVLGTINTDGMEPGQVQKLRNSLEINTKTMVSFMANEARNAVYKENSDIISGVVGLSTLDLRCCITCGTTIDGVEYSSIAKAPKLPLHPQCRCLWLPKIKGMPEYLPGDERASFQGPVKASLKWKDWLKTQPDEYAQEILGKSRFERFKKGADVGDFTEDGRVLTLKELAEK